MGMNFPFSRRVGDMYSYGKITYTWNGYAWMADSPAHMKLLAARAASAAAAKGTNDGKDNN